MSKRALLVVLDSVGCGGAPDAESYGDSGANTLGHLYERIAGFRLPHLESLGLASLLKIEGSEAAVRNSSAFRLTEHSAGKDTTTGHWELMGCPIEEAFFTCTEFPPEFVELLEQTAGVVSSGTRWLPGQRFSKN